MNTQEINVNTLPPRELATINGSRRIVSTPTKKSKDANLLLVVGIDFLLFNLSILSIISLKASIGELFTNHANLMGSLLLVTNLTAIFVAAYTNLYRITKNGKLKLKVKDLLWSTLMVFAILSLVYYQFFYSSLNIHFLIPAFFGFVIPSGVIHLAFRYYNRDKTSYLSYAVIGGENSDLKYLSKVFSSTYGNNAHCLGQFCDHELPSVLRLGGYADITNFIKDNDSINKLIYFDSPLSTKEIQRIGQLCRNQFIEFAVVPTQVAYFEKGTQIEHHDSLPILYRRKEPLCSLKNRILKRTFDIIFSLLVIVLVYPWLFPIIALLIKLESRGPVFFIQERTGYWNMPFRCFKFRSMAVNKDANEKQAVKNDMRITKVGAFLRKTNLDELPQFLNVLKGDMSVVGPRPHMVKHTELYSDLIDKYMVRHEVKPGISGWAQVNGWRGPTDEVYKMAKRVEFDVFYIEHWSFWLDLKCIFLTVFNIFKGDENAF